MTGKDIAVFKHECFSGMKMIKRQVAKLINLKDRRGDFSSFDSRIARLKDCHKGERCFIVGTGPSINKTNLSLLKDEICFGVNTLYSIKPDCKYWVLADYDLWKKKFADIFCYVKSDFIFLTEFISVNLIDMFSGFNEKVFWNQDTILIRSLGSSNVWDKVSTDLLRGTFSGGTVVVQAVQIAYYMGFKEVYLLGCDCDYSGIHHFDGLSTGDIGKAKGKMVSGDAMYVFNAYRRCRDAFEDGNRIIYNATIGGKLEVFERKRLEDI